MKNIALVVLLALAVVFGSLYLREEGRARQAENTLATLRQEINELKEKLNQQEHRSAALQTRLQDTRAKAVAKSEEVTHLEQALTNKAAQAAAKTENPMAEMLKNPEMKEFVKAQQKTALSGIIDKNYASLFSKLGLTPEQTAPLKDLILKKSLVDAQTGIAMISGDADANARSKIFEQAKTEKDVFNDQIKQVLGDDRYPEFEAYEKSQPERMAIGMFKDQQASGPAVITPEQEDLLVQAMSQERQNFKFTTDFYDQTKVASDLAGSFTEEKLNQFMQERGLLDQKYLERAQTILTADQFTSFQKFVQSQGQVQSAALKMAVKMFAPKPVGN
jgi:hypothetical protein